MGEKEEEKGRISAQDERLDTSTGRRVGITYVSGIGPSAYH